MNEELIATVAKRTALDVVSQIKQTPFIVIPFAIAGIFYGGLTVSLITMLFLIAADAYLQYKDLLAEIDNDVKNAVYESNITPEQSEPTEPNVVVAETEKK